mmetsp:Transcript_75887/g.210607  ORF Transcript_75887/g.210607 Transcript_75887/m.210607 type:complete len:99 (+) Transcript_75887:160-456(+)
MAASNFVVGQCYGVCKMSSSPTIFAHSSAPPFASVGSGGVARTCRVQRCLDSGLRFVHDYVQFQPWDPPWQLKEDDVVATEAERLLREQHRSQSWRAT